VRRLIFAPSLGIKLDPPNFPVVDALLRLTTKYQVKHIRSSLLREIQRTWPVRLAQWEVREAEATDSSGQYDARQHYPHPMYVAFEICRFSLTIVPDL
jgi:hypothetical protein